MVSVRSWRNGITQLVSNEAGSHGFRARIHVFTTAAVPGLDEEQVGWVEREVARCAQGDGFKVVEKARLRPRGSGHDQVFSTRTPRAERVVQALRYSYYRHRSSPRR